MVRVLAGIEIGFAVAVADADDGRDILIHQELAVKC